SIRTRARVPRVSRRAGPAARSIGPHHRCTSGRAAPHRDRRRGTDDPIRLRSEGLGESVSEPVIYVLESGPDYWLAHVPVLRGCVASGTSRDAAIVNARRAFRAYRELLDARGVSIEHWKDLDPDRFAVMEPEDTEIDHVVLGRRWTTRRVMRRILEHEFEHLGQIKAVLGALGAKSPAR